MIRILYYIMYFIINIYNKERKYDYFRNTKVVCVLPIYYNLFIFHIMYINIHS